MTDSFEFGNMTKNMKSLVYDKIRLGVAVLLYLCATSWADAKGKVACFKFQMEWYCNANSLSKVWGTADAGENITIEFQKKSYHATADAKRTMEHYTTTAESRRSFPNANQ